MDNAVHSLMRAASTTGIRSKVVHEDIFGGSTRFGPLLPRREDYAEIFGGFHTSSSRVFSIPVLDLPSSPSLELDARPPTAFQYDEVFGGCGNSDFAVSYDEIVKNLRGYSDDRDGILSDADDDESGAWTFSESEYLSERSNSKDRRFSNDDISNESIELRMLHQKSVKGGGVPNEINAAAPEKICFVDSFPNIDDEYLPYKVRNGHLNAEFNETTELHHANGGKKFDRNESLKCDSFVTVSEVSLITPPSCLPPPRRPPPAYGEVRKNYDCQSDDTDGSTSPNFFDAEANTSSSAAASAAFKNALKNAEVKLKSAKEFMEKRKGYEQEPKSNAAECSKVKLKIAKEVAFEDVDYVTMLVKETNKNSETARGLMEEIEELQSQPFKGRKGEQKEHGESENAEIKVEKREEDNEIVENVADKVKVGGTLFEVEVAEDEEGDLHEEEKEFTLQQSPARELSMKECGEDGNLSNKDDIVFLISVSKAEQECSMETGENRECEALVKEMLDECFIVNEDEEVNLQQCAEEIEENPNLNVGDGKELEQRISPLPNGCAEGEKEASSNIEIHEETKASGQRTVPEQFPEQTQSEKMKRDLERDLERLKKMEEERERAIEREKDRMAIDMNIFETRANRECRERAERAVVERIMNEARERLEKACADAREQSLTEKANHAKKTDCHSRIAKPGESESPQRLKARLERHRRIAERAAQALAEKNKRDLLAQREKAERNRFAETLDAEVKRWSSGKEGNLRALLSTLQYILGSDSGWRPVPLTEVITAAAVKKAYRRATLCVHPDKLQQRGATIQQKYVCEKVFDLLKEAWNKFNSEER